MVSRRTVLRLAAFAAFVPVAACTPDPSKPPPPDPLADLAAQARTDAALAKAIAAAQPAAAAAATAVAQARTEHARVLQAEVDRATPPPSPPSGSSSKAPEPQVPADGVTALVDAMTSAEKAASDLVPSVPRYRAGLLGSVAAGCASLRVVLRP
ncbi:hypothetical protein [Actinophytocola sp.]|uniref:hypothetical protein n=1 Tax=Actinophytocola sp. TaxID=1872138 RepID=UPI00389A1247